MAVPTHLSTTVSPQNMMAAYAVRANPAGEKHDLLRCGGSAATPAVTGSSAASTAIAASGAAVVVGRNARSRVAKTP